MAGRAVTPELGRGARGGGRQGRQLLHAISATAASAAATSNTACRRSRRNRSAPMPRAARGRSPGLLKPGVRPPRPGLYLMDTVNDGPVRYGIPNINDTQTVTEMVASGCHMIVFTTGAGSVVGQAVAPVIKGVSNRRVFQRMADDMDVNGGTIADGVETIEEVGERDRRARIVALASGEPSQVGGARPPGIRPVLQDLRTARARPACRFEKRPSAAEQRSGITARRTEMRMKSLHGSLIAVALGSSPRAAAPRAPRTTSGCASTGCITARMRASLSARTRATSRMPGINLDIRSGNGSGSAHRLVANGDSTFSYGSCASMINLAAKGAPLDLGRRHRRDGHGGDHRAAGCRRARRSPTSRARRCSPPPMPASTPSSRSS